MGYQWQKVGTKKTNGRIYLREETWIGKQCVNCTSRNVLAQRCSTAGAAWKYNLVGGGEVYIAHMEIIT